MSLESVHDWAAIRAAYRDGLNDKQLSKRFKVTDRSIRRRRAADAATGSPWLRAGEVDASAPAPASPSSDAPKASPDSPSAADALGNVVQLLQGGKADAPRADRDSGKFKGTTHQNNPPPDENELVDLAMTGTKLMWEAYNLGQIEPTAFQSEADLVHRMVVATTAVIAAKRQVDGKRPGQPSGNPVVDPDANRIIVEQRKLETKVIPVDERGRAISA